MHVNKEASCLKILNNVSNTLSIMTTGMSRRQSACNACILKQARWCVCACLCMSISVGGLIYVYLATFAHSNDAWYHIFIYSSQKWHPGTGSLRHICCHSSHLSVTQTAQCSVATFKRKGLYYNQTLVKLAVAHREMCTLKWALPVRHKRRNAEKDWKSGGDHSEQGCGCEFSHRTVWCGLMRK